MDKKNISCILLKFSIIFAIIFSFIDFFWIFVYNNVLRKNYEKTTWTDIYYLLMVKCKFYNINGLNNKFLTIIYVFLFYFYISFFILFIIIIILKYDIIENNNKYNYYYLLNVFILISFFIMYYSGASKNYVELKNLLNKYLTPEEKIIYKKTWGDI